MQHELFNDDNTLAIINVSTVTFSIVIVIEIDNAGIAIAINVDITVDGAITVAHSIAMKSRERQSSSACLVLFHVCNLSTSGVSRWDHPASLVSP